MADSIEINLGGKRPSKKDKQPEAVDLQKVLKELVSNSIEHAVRSQLGSVASSIYSAVQSSLDSPQTPSKPPSSPGSQPPGGSQAGSGTAPPGGGSGTPPPPGPPPGTPPGPPPGPNPPPPPGPPPGPPGPGPGPGPGGPPNPPGPLPVPVPPPTPPTPPSNPAVWVLAVMATAAVLLELADAAKRVKDYLDGLAEELAPYNPAISLAQANAAIASFESDMRRANVLGPGLSGFVPESNRLSNEIKELGSTLLEPFLADITTTTKTIADAVWLLHAGISPVLELWKKYEALKESSGLFSFNPLNALDQLELLGKGVSGLKDFLEDALDKTEAGTDINDVINGLLDPAKFLEEFEKLPSPTDIGYPSRRK